MHLAAKEGWVRCHASSLIYHDRIEIKSELIRLTFLHVSLNVIKSLSLISWLLKLLGRRNIFTPNHFNMNLDTFYLTPNLEAACYFETQMSIYKTKRRYNNNPLPHKKLLYVKFPHLRINILLSTHTRIGRGSSFGTGSSYGLDGRWSNSGAERFSRGKAAETWGWQRTSNCTRA
jgi:hypothetical protein